MCHVYIDKSANLAMARSIVLDAKINYPNASSAMVSNSQFPFDSVFSPLACQKFD